MGDFPIMAMIYREVSRQCLPGNAWPVCHVITTSMMILSAHDEVAYGARVIAPWDHQPLVAVSSCVSQTNDSVS